MKKTFSLAIISVALLAVAGGANAATTHTHVTAAHKKATASTPAKKAAVSATVSAPAVVAAPANVSTEETTASESTLSKTMNAMSGVYGQVHAGGSLVRVGEMKNDIGSLERYHKGTFLGGAALGYDFSHSMNVPVRIELDYTMRGKAKKNFAESKDAAQNVEAKGQMNTLMLNGYYDFNNDSPITPYVKAGVGLAFDKVDANVNNTSVLSHKKDAFAWGAGIGASYKITGNLSTSFGIDYVNGGKVKYDGHSTKLSSADIVLGLRYTI